jgi:hypothetical protein
MSRPTRLIIFMELVRGCQNVDCPSWGVVCKYEEQTFVTSETLNASCQKIKEVLAHTNPFEVIDIWAYGCGDSLDHPHLCEMLSIMKSQLGDLGKMSMAIDSRREVPGHFCKGAIVDEDLSRNRWLIRCHTCDQVFEGVSSNSQGAWVADSMWYSYLDKIKIIHKKPEEFDWLARAKTWSALPITMSHKLITNRITGDMWDAWKHEPFLKELKAVPWHDIELGTSAPIFTKREKILCDTDVPSKEGPYPGRPVRRIMVNWDGSLRRCLVSPTQYSNLHDLILGEDRVCQTCFPLTGGGLAKFYEDHVLLTPSASCVSDGYFVPNDF